MKKIIIGIILGMLILHPANIFAETALDKKKRCIAQCNKDYPGDTVFDGAQRTLCRLGCDVAYLLDELF